jgi:hypothetical protein
MNNVKSGDKIKVRWKNGFIVEALIEKIGILSNGWCMATVSYNNDTAFIPLKSSELYNEQAGG